MDTLRGRDAVIPRCLHRHACEDNGEDGRDPEHSDHYSDAVDQVSQEPVWEDPDVGCHDGEFGEGYRGRVCEVAAIERFGDATYVVWEVEEVGTQVPDVLSEAEAFAY